MVLDFFARTKKFLYDDLLLVLIIPYGFAVAIVDLLEDDVYSSFSKHSKVMHDQHWYHVFDEYVHSNRSANSGNRVKIMLCTAPDSAVHTFIDDMKRDTTLSHNSVTWNKAYSLFYSRLLFGRKVISQCPP